MNGSLHSNVVEIELKRGSAGLGFNIVGGVDQQYVANDCGIYVSKIKEDGAAALDGRLEEGDKILMINGVKLEAQTHNEVVNLFRKAGEDVELRVLKKSPHHANGPPNSPQSDPTWSGSYVGILAVLMGAAAILSLVYLGRVRRAI
ncbi:synaptojanin-2-binding protein isoform X1 [Nerophis lumbriciformis]|uniref:synaptojanin-2-binding protein isoform X1 n=1 Tax=Nerophis lumbriciformis TaxID=546530 RepID=UPI002ADF0D44|nr:synaptojanin-2-binding protein-like isoform X1 [Nerophis lumbriciformis]